MDGNPPLLEIEELCVGFPSERGVLKAVDGMCLRVEKGEILSIVGESGSGKSVAMLALMGLLGTEASWSAKRLFFDGIDLQDLSAKERRRILGKEIAMIFQEPGSSLNPCFPVGYQIEEMLAAHSRLNRRERRERTIELLRHAGIPAAEQRVHAFPHQLSGGMNQRVMIAMAIACGPRLLIADEPTTALDVTIQAQILDLLCKLRDETGMALLLITHDMGVVAETAERVSVMYAGRQVENRTVTELFTAPRHPYTSALLQALPDRAPRHGHLPAIPGTVPGIDNRPSGCLFHPRCAHAQDDCRTREPALERDGSGFLRCFHPCPPPAGGRGAKP